MKIKSFYGVFYMFVVTALFSSILIGISQGTRQRVESNQELAFEKSVLEAFGRQIEYRTDAEAHEFFTLYFKEPSDQSGWYRFEKDGQLKGYAVLIGGKGFWAPIKGIVGIQPDGRTITGLSFYEQNETPGLGARIAEPDFCDQFTGRKLQLEGVPLEMRPEGQKLTGGGQVHAITGATQTCMRLELFMNEDLIRWMKTMKQRELSP